MKRVVTKITKVDKLNWHDWDWTVSVDGEEYAAGSAPRYQVAASTAHGYVMSLSWEAEDERDRPQLPSVGKDES